MKNQALEQHAFISSCLQFILAVSAFAGIAIPARADISFSVTPALNDLVATPGASGEQIITLTNSGSAALDISIIVEDSAAAAPERSAVSWLSLEDLSVQVEPGEQRDIRVGIDVPKETPSGGYYAKVTFTTGSADTADNSAAISGQLSVGMLLTINGKEEIVRKASIARFAPLLDGDGRVSFQMVVESAGNVHIIPGKADVDVRNADGSPLGKLDFDGTIPILPGNSATLTTHGSLPLTLDGTYQAVASFSYGDETISSTVDFSVAPSLAIAGVSVCENLDRGPTFGIDLNNDGDLALQPQVTMSLQGGDGSPLGQSSLPAGTPLWAQTSTHQSIDFPERLISGPYLLITEVQFDPRQPPLRQETPFQIGGLEGTPAPLCSALTATPAA